MSIYQEKERIDSDTLTQPTAAAIENPIGSASEPILSVTIAKTRKSCRLRSGLLSAKTTSGRWLERLGLWDMIFTMMLFSQKYRLLLMIDWDDHLDDPDWLGRTMARTFMQLTPEDKDTVRAQYEDWLWYQNTLDMHKMANPEFNALCYLLDRKGNRVRNDKGEITVMRGLKGQTKQEALQTLDPRCYEFKQWW